jgi:hypothetical protein
MAAALAKRVRSSPDRIEFAFQLCFNRAPDAKEIALAEKFFKGGPADDVKLLTAFCQSLLASAEFRFATNHHEHTSILTSSHADHDVLRHRLAGFLRALAQAKAVWRRKRRILPRGRSG